MAPRQQASHRLHRGPIYASGGVLLIALLVAYGFRDDLRRMFATAPSASSIEGAWIFDAERAGEDLPQANGDDRRLAALKKRYGRTTLTFTASTYRCDHGDGTAPTNPSKIQGYPPNAFLVTIGEGKKRQEDIFLLEIDKAGRHLFLNTEGAMVPFKPGQ